MEKTMNATVFSGKGIVEYVQRPIPKLSEGETLIRVESAGICGTDMAIFAGKHPRAKAPLIMGHEVGGIIADIAGKHPKELKIGSRVTFFPLLSCGTCYTCRNGNTHVCENLKLVGIDRDGGMAEYVTVATDSVLPVPENWDKNRAALIEPVAVAVHSVRRSSIKPGDSVLVLGAGIIGNLCGQMAKASGATMVVIADSKANRLSLAEQTGLIPVNIAEEDITARARELTDGVGFDVTMECSGSAGAQIHTTALTRVLGEIVIVGMPKEPPPVDLRLLAFKELSMVGTRVYVKEDFRRAIEFVEQNKIAIDHLATHEFTVEQVKDAFACMEKAEDSLKILVTF